MSHLQAPTPTTIEAYIALIDEALLEIRDLYDALDYEMDGLSKAMDFIPRVETELQALKQALLTEQTHRFGADLEYMPLISNQNTYVLPFKLLLTDISRIHRQGLGLDAQDS